MWMAMSGVLILLQLLIIQRSLCNLLVSSPTCEIPYLDPFVPETVKLPNPKDPDPVCDPQPKIFELSRDSKTNNYKISINETEALSAGLAKDGSCCVQEILREFDGYQRYIH